MNSEIPAFAAGTIFTILLLTTGHWMPLRLSRIQAYIYGTASILAGFAVWRLAKGDWLTPAGLAIIAVAGGVTVKAAYTADDVTKRVSQARMAEAADDDL